MAKLYQKRYSFATLSLAKVNVAPGRVMDKTSCPELTRSNFQNLRLILDTTKKVFIKTRIFFYQDKNNHYAIGCSAR